VFQFYTPDGGLCPSGPGCAFSRLKISSATPYADTRRFCKGAGGEKHFLHIGSLPTLIGAEYTFSFREYERRRGLLWNQETAISRGIKLNQAMGKSALV